MICPTRRRRCWAGRSSLGWLGSLFCQPPSAHFYVFFLRGGFGRRIKESAVVPQTFRRRADRHPLLRSNVLGHSPSGLNVHLPLLRSLPSFPPCTYIANLLQVSLSSAFPRFLHPERRVERDFCAFMSNVFRHSSSAFMYVKMVSIYSST